MKRLFDLGAVLLAAPLWLPALIAVGLLVRWKLGSPVFFVHQRLGLNEKPFRLIKFRSMLDSRGPDGEWLPDADRLTPFGKWLRSTSLDELPELLNVLRGEMSLVGPRPLLLDYLPHYNERQRLRHRVRPGITGWAQINGRNASSWPERLEQDAWYVENASFLLDLKILLQTIPATLKREGIHAAGMETMPRFQGNGPRPPEGESGDG